MALHRECVVASRLNLTQIVQLLWHIQTLHLVDSFREGDADEAAQTGRPASWSSSKHYCQSMAELDSKHG